MTMLMNTIKQTEVVIANVSANGTEKTAARKHPATPMIALNINPVFNSAKRKCLRFSSFTLPVASPRITGLMGRE